MDGKPRRDPDSTTGVRCCVCGAPVVSPGASRALTCGAAPCRRVVEAERGRARERRRKRSLGYGLRRRDVCERCLYETAVCRCGGTPRVMRAPFVACAPRPSGER